AFAGAGLVTFLVGCIASDASWQQVLFNAVQVHAATPVDQPWHQRLDIGRELFSDVGCFALVAAGALCVTQRPLGGKLWERDHLLAVTIAFALTGGYLLARPSWAQYFTSAVPFW